MSSLVVSLLVGPGVLFHPLSAAVGVNPASDFQVMTWSLEWWPWAIQHGLNPLHTRLLWSPEGFSTLWMTTIPIPALLGAFVTLIGGPLLAYNWLMLIAVPLACAAAYLLCRELTGRPAPSVVGGLVFGLSPYMLGHTLSQHLDLTFVFPVPLLGLLIIRYVRGKTSRRRFVVGFAGLLLLLLGVSFELFVDLAVVVALGFALALIRGVPGRDVVVRTAGTVALAYAACLPVLLAVAALAFSTPHGPIRYAASDFSIDAANVVVPTPTNLAGAFGLTRALSRHFVGNIGEQDGYLGLPLLIVALLALRKERRRTTWLVGALFLTTVFLSFGPVLTAGGWPLVRLPFSPANLQVLRDALPARMSMFSALGAGCLCALWRASPRRRLVQCAVTGVILASLLPNFWPASRLAGAWATSDAFGWSSPHISQGFADDQAWTRLVRPGSSVLVMPTADRSAAEYWQAQSRMAFTLAVPVTPFVPPDVVAAPAVRGLVDNILPLEGRALASARLRAFLRTNHVGAVVVARAGGRRWLKVAAAATAARPVRLDGFTVYGVHATLPPLRATGDLAVARSLGRTGRTTPTLDRPSIRAWLRFDGLRAVLHVLYRSARESAGPQRVIALSSPNGDASATATAVGAGRAAVAFTEWRKHREFLRIATTTHGQWRTQTLDSNSQPIWSPRVAITPRGTTIAVWIDETDPLRKVRAAVLRPGDHWRAAVTLETGEGFGALALRAGPGDTAACAWRDSLANEERVRVSRYVKSWETATTLATTESSLRRIAFAGPTAALLRWRLVDPLTGSGSTFVARRTEQRWIVVGRSAGPHRAGLEPRDRYS